MQDVNVVVVFQSRFGATEHLALAAAVGAVQGSALIRLRWLAEESGSDDPERPRMMREYVGPRETDANWAEAIVLAIPDRHASLTPEFQSYLDSLRQMHEQGKLAAKCAVVVTAGAASNRFREAVAAVGIEVLPAASGADSATAARLSGRALAEHVRATRGHQAKSNFV